MPSCSATHVLRARSCPSPRSITAASSRSRPSRRAKTEMAAPPSIPLDAERQLPLGAEIFLDHVGHFVADADAASGALARAGFAPAPKSIQTADGQRTGTGNVTAMLERGYIEVLFKTADTALGREFDASLARYHGLHLIAFAVAD